MSCDDVNEETRYSVTIDSMENVSILEDVDLSSIKIGTVITIKVTVPEGKVLEKFSVDGKLVELTNLEYKLTVVKNHVIKVVFKDIEDNIPKYSVTLGEHLKADATNLTDFKLGDVVVISVLIPEGKLIDKFLVDGVKQEIKGTQYTLTVSKNHEVTVTFKDAPPPVVVTFDLNGGTLEGLTLENTFPSGAILNKPSGTPTKEGHTFVEWRLNNEAYNFGAEVSTDLTLIAHYKVNVYVVTFNTDGGNPISSINKDYDTKLTELPIPEKEGYTFDGWYIDDAKINNSYVVKNNITLKAKWTIKQYTVIFDTLGGEEINSLTKDHGTKLGTLPTPVKEGYIFVEWHLNGEIYDGTAPIKNNITLTAYYRTKVYEVTFVDGDKSEKVSVKHGDLLNPLFLEEKEGLVGVWHLNGVTYDFNRPITSDLTLNSHYGNPLKVTVSGSQTNEYILTFSEDVIFDVDVNDKLAFLKRVFISDFDYSYVDLDAVTITYSENKLKLKITNNFVSNTYLKTVSFDEGDGSGIHLININLNKTSVKSKANGIYSNTNIEPYNLKLWVPFSDNSADYTKPVSAVFLNDADTIADWHNHPMVRYNVKFVSEDTQFEEIIEVNHGNKVTRGVKPQREGFVLTGWLLDDDLFDFETPIKSNLILKAKWSEASTTVKVSFNTNSPHQIEPVFVAKGGTVSVPEAITVAEYEFVGWYLGDVLYDFSLPVNENITLTAVWERKLVLVTINLNGGTGLSEISVPYGSEPGIELMFHIEKPVKEGYVFAGYEQIFNNTIQQILEPTTLDVIWLEENLSLTFNYMYDNKVEVIKVSNDFIQLFLSIMAMDETHILASTPQREGYKFVGWYSNSDYSEPMFSEYGLSLSLNYYAKWIKYESSNETYKITYNSIGGTQIEPVDVLVGQIYEHHDVPTKEGYRFMGWYVDSDYRLRYKQDYDIGFYYDSDITLYAKWVEDDFGGEDEEVVTITVVSNAPFGNMEFSVQKGSVVNLRYDLSHYYYGQPLVDYEFLGVYDKSYENKYGDWVIFDENTTIYVKWQKRIKVTYILDDKLIAVRYYGNSVKFNEDHIPNSIVELYELYYDKALTIKFNESPIYDTELSKDLDVYLKEKKARRNVEYIINISDNLTLKVNGMYGLDLSRDGEMFEFFSQMFFLNSKASDGFYLDENLTVPIEAVNYEDYIIGGKLNIYVKWRDVIFIKVETDTFDEYYDFGKTDIISLEVDETFENLEEKLSWFYLEKQNHVFDGFYLDKNFTEPLSLLEDREITSNIVIYVKWIYEEPIIVTVDTNGRLPLFKVRLSEYFRYAYFEGYHNGGIFYDNNYVEDINFENNRVKSGDTIYLKLLNVYDVTVFFLNQDGEETIYNNVRIHEGEVISEYVLPHIINGEQMIVGWKLNGEDFDIDKPFIGQERNVELKPVWGPIAYYSVKFRIDGVIDEDLTCQVLQNQTFANSHPRVNLPWAPYVDGYSFVCWLTDDEELEFSYHNSRVTSDIILKPLYVRNDDMVTVSFDTGIPGFSIDPIEVRRYNLMNASLPDVFLTKEGYKFDDWLYNGESVYLIHYHTRIQENITLVAKWVPHETCKVTMLVGDLEPIILYVPKMEEMYFYDSVIYDILRQNNAEFDQDNFEIVEIMINDMEVEYYKFTEDVTMYVQVLDVSYVTVNFKVNGEIKDTYYDFYRKNTRIDWLPRLEWLEIPVELEDGKVFVCWLLNGEEVGINDILQGDATLVARIEDAGEVTISFVTNVPGITIESVTLPKYIIVGEPQQPLTKENYVFLGWGILGTNEIFNFYETRIEESFTLEALFAPAVTHKVTINLGEGHEPVELHFEDGSEIDIWNMISYYNLNPGGNRTFYGFYHEGREIYHFVVERDMILDASWKDDKFATVTFKVDDVTYATIKVMIGTSIHDTPNVSFPANPEKEGQIFSHWQEAFWGGVILDEWTIIDSNIIVYAQWLDD